MGRPREFNLLATPPRVVLANFFPFAAGQGVGPFWCESSFFLLVVRGRGTIWVGSKQFVLSSGQAVHAPWASPVKLVPDQIDPLTVLSVHLSYQPWAGATSAAAKVHVRNVSLAREVYQRPPHPQLFTAAFVVNIPPNSPLLEIASDIAHTWEAGITEAAVEMREARLRGLALTFLAEFHQCLRAGEQRSQSGASAAQISMVREIASFMEIDLSYPQKLQRKALAARAGVSETTLAKAFHAVTGRGPIDYLIELRISQARHALRTSRAKVSEIATQVGIPNLYYFSKLFKKRVGCSPLQYRMRLQIR